jgi:hypothetical protein
LTGWAGFIIIRLWVVAGMDFWGGIKGNIFRLDRITGLAGLLAVRC